MIAYTLLSPAFAPSSTTFLSRLSAFRRSEGGDSFAPTGPRRLSWLLNADGRPGARWAA